MKTLITCVLLVLLSAVPASARVVLCDTSYQNCRVPLLDLIKAETKSIDVAMWFMEDMRYAYALIDAQKRGVKVRVIMNTPYAAKQVPPLDALRAAGIPMRISYIAFHTKAMIFGAQRVLEIGGANFTASAFRPEIPYVNYTDEVVAFLNEPWYVEPAMWEFDNKWTSTDKGLSNYSNAPDWSLRRLHPVGPYFGPGFLFLDQGWYRARIVELIRSEPSAIDIIMYRFTDPDIWHELHLAQERGVKVRLLSDPRSYNEWREAGYIEPWQQPLGVYHMAIRGGQYKQRVHQGLTHEKLVIFHGQARVLLGSQNLTRDVCYEWNVDLIDPNAYWWSVQHFNRKWDSNEFLGISQFEAWW